MPNVGHFHHLVMEVSDLERSAQFCEEIVGLEPVGRDLFPEAGPNAAYRTGEGQYFVLMQVPDFKPTLGVHTNFMLPTSDYRVVYERLKERRCLVIDHRAEQRSVGEVSTYFSDPDGQRLQITAFEPEAFQVPAAKRGKIIAGRLEDFPVGSVTHVREGKFYLVRLQDGILALNQVCTHQQCDVTYQPEHYRFFCPCHYNKFTRKGEHIGHTLGTPPLHAYAIEIVNGQIVIDTDRTIPRLPEEADRMVEVPVS